ncbi:MAG: phosphomannomutase/phosphoglucomutase [Patescibacteria group bacterium]|nr:phosphomannomutase/phosphoglucomutase [Patescibacteria group bacterium]
MLQKQVFKSYDIRGIYPDELDDSGAYEIGLIYLSLVCKRTGKNPEDLKIFIARDIRNSSFNLHKSIIDAFVSRGVHVYDAGLMSVDVIYFAVGKYDYDGGIMVTASHNPGSYGGFKMISRGVEWIRGGDMWNHKDEMTQFPEKVGSIELVDIWKDYLDHIFSFVDFSKIKKLKIVVDSGNGMAGIMIPKILERLPQIELIPLFFEPDGNFPNRNPNPLGEGAYHKLSERVVLEHADVGFIYDADSDRVFLVDENGKFLPGDDVLLVLAKQLLQKNPKCGIVYNLVSSKDVKEYVERMGGYAIRSEVGYVNMGVHMKKDSCIMGGEISAHFSYAKNYYSDSGYIAFLMILEAISEENFKLSEFMSSNKRWHRFPEIVLPADNMTKILDNIRSHYKDNILDEIDGITVEFPDWWFNARGSNTEPILKITIEVLNEEDIDRRRDEVTSVLNF